MGRLHEKNPASRSLLLHAFHHLLTLPLRLRPTTSSSGGSSSTSHALLSLSSGAWVFQGRRGSAATASTTLTLTPCSTRGIICPQPPVGVLSKSSPPLAESKACCHKTSWTSETFCSRSSEMTASTTSNYSNREFKIHRRSGSGFGRIDSSVEAAVGHNIHPILAVVIVNPLRITGRFNARTTRYAHSLLHRDREVVDVLPPDAAPSSRPRRLSATPAAAEGMENSSSKRRRPLYRGSSFPSVESVADVIISSSSREVARDQSNIPAELTRMNIPLSGDFVARVLNLVKDGTLALIFFRWAASQQARYQHGAHAYRLMIRKLNDSTSENVETILLLAREMVEKGWNPGLPTCNFVVGRLCKANRLNCARQFVQVMESKGYPLNVRTYNLLLGGLSKAGTRNHWDEMWKLYDKLQQQQQLENHSATKPNVVTYGILISGLCQEGKLEEALALSESMKAHHGCDPDVVIYSTLLTALRKAGRLQDACKVFDAMESAGHKPDVVAFSSLISGFCNAGRLEEAFFLFSKMVQQGCQPDAVSCNSLISGYCKAGEVDAALNLFSELRQMVVNTSTTPLSIESIIVTLFNAGRIDEAVNLYESILQNGDSISDGAIYTHTMMVNELCKAGQLDAVFALLCRLQQREARIILSPSTYMTVIESLLLAGQWERARILLQKLSDNNSSPGPGFYKNLVESLSRAGQLGDACSLFQKMKQGGFVPNLLMYNCCIYCLAKAGNFTEALRVLQEMEAQEKESLCAPDVVTYNSLLHWTRKHCDWDKFEDVYARMLARHCTPDIVTYTILLDAKGMRGRLDEMWALFREAKQRGCVPDSYTFNTLIKSVLKSGPTREAPRLVKAMEKAGCPPDVITYNLLIAGLGKSGRMEKALKSYEQIAAQGDFAPDMISHSTLISQLGRDGQWEKALNHFRQIEDQAVSCNDVVIFNSIVHVLCKAGQLVKAVNILKEMEGGTCDPDVVTYNCILDGFCKRSQAEEAIHFFLEMQRKGCTPDLITYCTLIRALCKTRQYPIVCQLLGEMQGRGLRLNSYNYHSLRRGLHKEPRARKAIMLLDALKLTKEFKTNEVSFR